MVDTVSRERRSEIMALVRSKDMKPEMAVRRIAHAMGYRYRLHRKDLPRRPDLVFPARSKVIFVHGCFWHQHSPCKNVREPKSNRDYWLPKLRRNVERDVENQERLSEIGWRALVLWECEVRSRNDTAHRIREFLERP